MQRIVLASGNRGKLAEFNHLLADSRLDVVAQGELGVADIEETGLTFVENALLKARHAARVTGLPALADDSGLCVETLRAPPPAPRPATPAPDPRAAGFPSAAHTASPAGAMQALALPRHRPPPRD